MKKIFCALAILLVGFTTTSCRKTKYKKIKLVEVARSIFYAPQYAAITKGYFKEEGLEIDLINANGADKVTAALLSNDAQIGLQGPEPTIYLYKNNKSNYLINFAQLTRTDGSFIFGRIPIENFTLADLKGKSILGGRKGGVPEMTLEYVLKQAGLNVGQDDDTKDVNVRTDVAFAALTGSFLEGEGDFVSLFEPTATEVEKQGYGHVVASIGELGGIVPYTSYSARISYINNNKELIKNFDKAIQKGLDYVKNHSDKEVAKAILKQFPDTSLNDLTNAVKRYREIEAWAETTKFSEESFNHLQDIMIDYGELQSKVDYSKLIYNEK